MPLIGAYVHAAHAIPYNVNAEYILIATIEQYIWFPLHADLDPFVPYFWKSRYGATVCIPYTQIVTSKYTKENDW